MKLLNFQIQGTVVELAGQTFDLHNFDLQSYTYDPKARMLVLPLNGFRMETIDAVLHKVIIDLQIIFRDVTFSRIQNMPYEDQYFCFLGMKSLDKLLAFSKTEPDAIIEVDNLFDSKEFPVAEWPNYLLINFTGGVDILIVAATAEVSFQKVVQGMDE